MTRPVLCIHGWHDHAASFKPLRDALKRYACLKHHRFYFCDYQSLDDDVEIDDIVDAFDANFPFDRLGARIDVITHSTGALILRAWLAKYFGNGPSPVERIIMLSPPLWGSYLANDADQLLSRLINGQHRFGHFFDVGQPLLRILSYPSTYTWHLNTQYIHNHVLPAYSMPMTTVLIGDQGYQGIKGALVNRPYGDGVVDMVSAFPCIRYMRIGWNQNQMQRMDAISELPYAFGVLQGVNHSTIMQPDIADGLVPKWIKSALMQSSACFDQMAMALKRQHGSRDQLPLHCLVRCQDQYGHGVDDTHMQVVIGYRGHLNRKAIIFSSTAKQSIHVLWLDPQVLSNHMGQNITFILSSGHVKNHIQMGKQSRTHQVRVALPLEDLLATKFASVIMIDVICYRHTEKNICHILAHL